MFDKIQKLFGKEIEIKYPLKKHYPYLREEDKSWYGKYYFIGIHNDGCQTYITFASKDKNGFYNTPFQECYLDEIRFVEGDKEESF